VLVGGRALTRYDGHRAWLTVVTTAAAAGEGEEAEWTAGVRYEPVVVALRHLHYS